MLEISRRTRRFGIGFVLILLLGAVGIVSGPSLSARADVTAGTAGLFVPVQGRLAATATGTNTAKAPLAPYTPRVIQVTGQAGLPSTGISAVMVTFTTVNPTVAGQASIGPADGVLSGVMRYDAGGTTSNSSIVSVSGTGQIQIQTTTTADVAVDVQGYYTAGDGVTAAGGYSPVTNTRIVDTINGVGLPKAKLLGGSTSTIQVSGKGGIPPTGASAVFVNFQVDNTNTASGYINPYATSATTRPGVGLNFDGSPYTSIGAIVPLNANGQILVYLATGNAINMLMDVEGYFTSGISNGTFTPAIGKIYDTRTKPAVSVKPGQTVTVPIGGTNGIPGVGDGLSAAVANFTVIDQGTKGGYARAWSDGTPEPTNVGTLTFDPQTAGSMTTNLATIPVGLDGAIEIHNVSADTVDYIVDLEGFYQNTSSSLCAQDADSILGTAANSTATIGADQGSPVVSAVVANSLNNPLNAEVYLVDSSGNSVSGSPAVAGTIASGEPLIYHLPMDSMTAGSSYTWWLHVYQSDGCASTATTAHHTFTLGTPPTSQTVTPSTLTISGSSLATASASSGATDCQGSPCTLTQGTLALGNDGTTQRISAFKANLSALPAGSQITGATLNITPTCFSSSCMTGNLSIAEANTDVTAAVTGPDVAGLDVQPGTSFPESPSTTSYDITSMAQDWYDGNNNGAVLTETNTNPGATGETFAGPADPSIPASVTISYQAPTVPTAVTNLTITPGDGGLIAAWTPPANTGWYDNTGVGNGITNYTAIVKAGGTTVTTQTVAGPRAVITGLTNGTNYTVTVTPNNSIGAGPATVSLPAAPVAVTGGPTKYVADVRDLLNAQDALQAGAALSTQDATSAATDPTAVSAALGTNAAAIEAVYTGEAISSQSETTDSTTLSNTLAVQSGNTVTVYTTATENYTTADTSTGAEIDVPDVGVADDAIQFTSNAVSPAYLRTVNAVGLLQPVTPAIGDTLATPPPSDGDIAPSSFTLPNAGISGNSTGTFTVNTNLAVSRMSATTASARVNRNGVASWAFMAGNLGGWDPLFRWDDCTDFVSRALHFGGGLREVTPTPRLWKNKDDNRNLWYEFGIARRPTDGKWDHYYSQTWSVAPWSAQYQASRGGRWVPVAQAAVGDIVYANFEGTGSSHIDHAAIVTAVYGGNIYVAQQSNPQMMEPIKRVAMGPSWQGSSAKVQWWVMDPSSER